MRAIRYCINEHLSTLCRRALELETLSSKVVKLLPNELAACRVSQFNKGHLILSTEEPAIASQLRYFIPELRDKLRKEGGLPELMSIKINVMQVCEDYKKYKCPKKPILSSKAKSTILEGSQRSTYPPLKEALLRLARANEMTK